MPAKTTSFASAIRIALLAPAVLLLAACDSGSPTELTPIDVDWEEWAEEYSGQINRRVAFRCPADGTPNWVWGTDIYTADSSVCTAAVHAGKITLAQGGVVTFQMRPGQAEYVGSTRNGITSEDWDEWDGSFIFP
jgi:hypothetical protein